MESLSAYAGLMAAASPYALQLAASTKWWPVLYPLFALPALSICLSVATLSRKGPLLTFSSLTPIAAGIGWALAFHVCERLLSEALRAAQTLLYLIFSFRTSLDWATECGHSYNSRNCRPFDEQNITSGAYYHEVDNFWPAQEFNRYVIRRNRMDNLSKTWEPNEWYIGRSDETFYLSLPSIPLVFAHLVIWSIIYALVVRFPELIDKFITRICLILPMILYVLVILGMALSGLSLGSTEDYIPADEVEKVPQDFWNDLKGFYRSSILIVDYSTAFTGVALLVVSRLNHGSSPVLAWIAVPFMMVIPILLSLLTSGCEGHISRLQPNYKTYGSTDESYSFDVIPVCLATSSFGSLWAILFYIAHFFYSCIGPMIIYSLFLYSVASEQFGVFQSNSNSFYSMLLCFVTAFGMILYMPLGTKIATFFRYASQSSTVHLLIFVLIFFVYGWQTLETDISMVSVESTGGALWRYFVGPTSPFYTALQFTVVPMLLCTKGVAVYDLLIGGNDVLRHIDMGTQFIAAPLFVRRMIGYGIVLGPVIIVLAFGTHAILNAKIRSISLGIALKPSTDWLSHQVMQHRPKPFSLAYVIFNRVNGPNYRTILLSVFISEIFFFLVLIMLLLGQMFHAWFGNPLGAANFRSIVLLVLLAVHAIALVEMRAAYKFWDDAGRLTIYIAVATLQMAFLNGYMWMFAFNHDSGVDVGQVSGPLFLIIINTALRALCICAAIAVRAHIREAARPSRTRDATEIYGTDGPPEVEMDAEDDAPIIFDLARA